MTTFPGIIPAVVVPFAEDDSIDVDALRANVTHLIDGGVHGLVVNGTMGEAGALSDDERGLVIDTVLGVADGRLPVTVGVSSTSTATSRRYAEQARAAGAQGVMCLPPVLYRGTPEELAAHFAAVTEASGLPVMAYNNPEASGQDLAPEAIAELAASVPAVVAVKECSGDARRIAELLGSTDLEILVGGDDWALEGFAAGSTGWVSGVANVAPRECVELFEAVNEGRLSEARELYQRLLPLGRLDMTPWLVQYFKGAMDAVGLVGGPTRPPRLPLGAEQQQALREAVDALGLRVSA
ncbi:MAG TPA: dihydrodipicolinate synthase family protein [Thermoleophilaceae bacterium]|jgi:4-hydroxy-tetrahydrodipicolinate synthase|nr:dihydrodipicolinate synthase family protein [Thermoleophilaceae bacterium]